MTGTTCALALRRAQESDSPRVAVLASVSFAGSMIAVSLGPSSVHLMLSAPRGLAALILQLVPFGFGGLTTRGANTLNIAMSGVGSAAPRRATSNARCRCAGWNGRHEGAAPFSADGQGGAAAPGAADYAVTDDAGDGHGALGAPRMVLHGGQLV